MKRVAVFIFPVTLVIAGIAVIAGFFVATKTATRSDRWTQAIATIERVSEVRPSAEVLYVYTFRGREHRSAQQSRFGRFRAGQTVVVYVNPAAPAESILEHGPRPSHWFWIGGTFAILLGATLAAYLARTRSTANVRSEPRRKTTVNRPRPMSRLRPPDGIQRKK